MTTIVLNITKDSIYNLLVETSRADIPSPSPDFSAITGQMFGMIGKYATENNISLEQKSFFCPVNLVVAKRIFNMLIQWEQYVDENLKTSHVDFCSSLKVWNLDLYDECMKDIYSDRYFKHISFN